jgi:hypothetical protein
MVQEDFVPHGGRGSETDAKARQRPSNSPQATNAKETPL